MVASTSGITPSVKITRMVSVMTSSKRLNPQELTCSCRDTFEIKVCPLGYHKTISFVDLTLVQFTKFPHSPWHDSPIGGLVIQAVGYFDFIAALHFAELLRCQFED